MKPAKPTLYLDIETWGGPPAPEVWASLQQNDLSADPVKTTLKAATDVAQALPVFIGWKLKGGEHRVIDFVDIEHRRPALPNRKDLEDLRDAISMAGWVVGHNVAFDIGVLRRMMVLFGIPSQLPYKLPTWKEGKVVCTLALFNQLFDGEHRTKGRSLAACCKAVGIPYEKRIDGELVPSAMLRICCSAPGLVASGWRDLAEARRMVSEDVDAAEKLHDVLVSL